MPYEANYIFSSYRSDIKSSKLLCTTLFVRFCLISHTVRVCLKLTQTPARHGPPKNCLCGTKQQTTVYTCLLSATRAGDPGIIGSEQKCKRGNDCNCFERLNNFKVRWSQERCPSDYKMNNARDIEIRNLACVICSSKFGNWSWRSSSCIATEGHAGLPPFVYFVNSCGKKTNVLGVLLLTPCKTAAND